MRVEGRLVVKLRLGWDAAANSSRILRSRGSTEKTIPRTRDPWLVNKHAVIAVLGM